jgi:hypothetical protein
MVISSNLSLIPYPLENYQLQPQIRQDLVPWQEHGQQAGQAYDLIHRPHFTKRFIQTDGQNSTYNPGCCMESSKLDQIGSLVDIYI